MAFISEVNFRGSGIANSGEFVEITLAPGDNPADFVVSVYTHTGALSTGSGLPTGEVNLSTLSWVPDPQNPGYRIYEVPLGIRNANSDADEGSAVALTDISAGGGVIDFYGAAATGPIMANTGAASGASSDAVLDHTTLSDGESNQWDLNGTEINGPITSGDATLCLTEACGVRTSTGVMRADALAVGTLVWTLDHGYQPIRWIGTSNLSVRDFELHPNKKPVRFAAHALGPNVPSRDVILSPQHRVLVRAPEAQEVLGHAEVLSAAKKLRDFEDIDVVETPEPMTYIHLLFDKHEILDVDGAFVESLLMGPYAATALGEGAYKDAFGAALPASLSELAAQPARPIVEGKTGRRLLDQLKRNGRDLQAAGESMSFADRMCA